MIDKKRAFYLVLSLFIILTFAFVLIFSSLMKRGGFYKPRQAAKTLEERAREMELLLIESNRQMIASSTLMKALQKKSAVMQKQQVEDNKKIIASSTLKAALEKSAAEMEKILQESNRQMEK